MGQLSAGPNAASGFVWLAGNRTFRAGCAPTKGNLPGPCKAHTELSSDPNCAWTQGHSDLHTLSVLLCTTG